MSQLCALFPLALLLFPPECRHHHRLHETDSKTIPAAAQQEIQFALQRRVETRSSEASLQPAAQHPSATPRAANQHRTLQEARKKTNSYVYARNIFTHMHTNTHTLSLDHSLDLSRSTSWPLAFDLSLDHSLGLSRLTSWPLASLFSLDLSLLSSPFPTLALALCCTLTLGVHLFA